MCFTFLNVLLLKEKFIGKCRELKWGEKTRFRKEAGRKEKKRTISELWFH